MSKQSALNLNTNFPFWAEYSKLRYAQGMHPSLPAPLVRAATYTAILLSLIACERDSYTSWNCSSDTESKVSMVLRKAQMEYKGDKLAYCGSLGNLSYFDHQCPAQIDQSEVIFTPSTGALSAKGKTFQCTAL